MGLILLKFLDQVFIFQVLICIIDDDAWKTHTHTPHQGIGKGDRENGIVIYPSAC